jgi:hypothetical protein
MHRKEIRWSLGSFPSGAGKFSTMCLFVHVSEHGQVHLEGLIRMPYSDRPKRGGGIGIPRSFLDMARVSRRSIRLNTMSHVQHEDNVATVEVA